MKRMFFRRACAALLCIFVFSAAVLSRPAAMNAHAASLAGALAIDEASMFLWNLLMNAFIACGVSASGESSGISTPIGSYDAESAAYEALVRYYTEEYGATADADMVFTLQNGSRYTLGDLMEAARWDIVGAEGCYIPDEATWQRFKLSAPSDTSAFSSIASVALSADLLEHMAGFAGALAAGEVEGLDAADYFPDGFDGTLETNAEGLYVVRGQFIGTSYYGSNHISYKVSSVLRDFDFSYPVVAYFQMISVIQGMPKIGYVYFMGRRTANEIIYVNVPATVVNYYPTGAVESNSNSVSYHADANAYSLNIPVFSSREAAELFLKTGDFTASDCENVKVLDYPALADAIPDTLAPLLAKELAPDILLDLYPALMDALNPALNPDIADTDNPALVLDPAAATDAYKKAVADTVADVAVSVPAVGTDTEDISGYKVNLTNVFPFCLPFDLIRLLDALDAEPVTPCFDFPFVVPALDIDMSVQLDLSFLDGVMEIFRLCETVSFIIMLIFVTPQLIRW